MGDHERDQCPTERRDDDAFDRIHRNAACQSNLPDKLHFVGHRACWVLHAIDRALAVDMRLKRTAA